MSVVSTSMEGNVKILIPFLQDLCGLSLKKKSDWVTSASCKILLRSRHGCWWEHQQESWQTLNLQRQLMNRKIFSPFLQEGDVQDHVKALKNRVRQFEAGCMTVCDNLMEERKKLWNWTRIECCSCGREPSERTRRSQTLLHQAKTSSWVDKVLHRHRPGVHWVFVTLCWWSCKESPSENRKYPRSNGC